MVGALEAMTFAITTPTITAPTSTEISTEGR